jgi:hypothetical protein
MKKFYILAAAFVGSFAINAQVAPKSVAAKIDRNEIRPVSKKGQNSTKVEGQQWWANGFNTIADWTQVNGPNHQGGDWDILTAIPAGIAGQQASYQWPSTFGGASGNFAFINSDAAGTGVAQDAYFQFTGNIDLSGAGSAAMYLTFAEYYRNYYDETFVEISNDGGVNWVTFEVNPEAEVPVNTNCVPNEVEVVNITPAMIAQGGTWSNQVKVRFHYKGVYDWFWGIDDVKIVEAWNNDVKVTNWYQATDVNTTFGLDYYHVPVSQSSFPGWTFGALGANNGGQNQPTVALSATATGGYVAAGSPVAIPTNSGDTLSISTPYLPTGLGTKTIELTTTLGANTDAALANNEKSMDVFLTNYEFSRDNNVIESSIGQISSQDAQPLKIGNVHEMFNDMNVTAIKLYLATQGAGAVGSEFFAELWKWNGVDAYEFLAETELKTVTGTTATWVTLPLVGGSLTVNAGDDILAVAGHFGGATEVRFGLAQNTYEGSVIGYTALGELFSLTSPGAVMIRLLDDPSVSLNEVTAVSGINVLPNPANNVANVSIELSNDAAVAITVTDLSGKVVYTTDLGTVNGTQDVQVNTSSFTSGVYMVNVTVDGAVTTQKLVVRK